MPDRKSKYSTLHKKMKTRKCKRNVSTNVNKKLFDGFNKKLIRI